MIGNVSRPGPQVDPPSFDDFCAAINRNCRSNARAMALPSPSSSFGVTATTLSRISREGGTNDSTTPPNDISSPEESPSPPAATPTPYREIPSTPRSLHDLSYGAFREYVSPSSSEDLSSCSSASVDPGDLTTSSDPGFPLPRIDEFEFSEEQQLMFISSMTLHSLRHLTSPL